MTNGLGAHWTRSASPPTAQIYYYKDQGDQGLQEETLLEQVRRILRKVGQDDNGAMNGDTNHEYLYDLDNL